MASRIVAQFHPDQIILFGSHARGDAHPDSDVDLLVVMPVDGSKREKMIEIGVALHDIPLPKDIIVSTPEEFAWRKEIIGTIERPAVREGEVPSRAHGDIPEEMAPRLRGNVKPVGQAEHVVIAQGDDKGDLAFGSGPRAAGEVAVTPPIEADRRPLRAAKAFLPPVLAPTTGREVVREVKHQRTV